MSIASYFFAEKIGNSHIFQDGKIVNVTLLKVLGLSFLRKKTVAKDGYNALVFYAGNPKTKNVPKPQRVEAEKLSSRVCDFVCEFRLSDDFNIDTLALQPNQDFLNLDDSILDTIVDVQGTTKGRGFTGTVKRWNFRTQDASHGNSRSHRVPGSTGNRQDPGRVFPGKKMCGHYGNETVTTKGLKVVYFKKSDNLIAVSGSIPGAAGGVVRVKTSTKDLAYFSSSLQSFSINNVKLLNS